MKYISKQWRMKNGTDINEMFSEEFIEEMFAYIVRDGVGTGLTQCDCDNYCASWYINKVETKYLDIFVTLNAYLGGDEVVIVYS